MEEDDIAPPLPQNGTASQRRRLSRQMVHCSQHRSARPVQYAAGGPHGSSRRNAQPKPDEGRTLRPSISPNAARDDVEHSGGARMGLHCVPRIGGTRGLRTCGTFCAQRCPLCWECRKRSRTKPSGCTQPWETATAEWAMDGRATAATRPPPSSTTRRGWSCSTGASTRSPVSQANPAPGHGAACFRASSLPHPSATATPACGSR